MQHYNALQIQDKQKVSGTEEKCLLQTKIRTKHAYANTHKHTHLDNQNKTLGWNNFGFLIAVMTHAAQGSSQSRRAEGLWHHRTRVYCRVFPKLRAIHSLNCCTAKDHFNRFCANGSCHIIHLLCLVKHNVFGSEMDWRNSAQISKS